MTSKFQKRRGIGNVITTLIILIASVVLGAGVIFFGGSMFQTNTSSESIKVTNVHSFVASNGTSGTPVSVTAFSIQNTGSKPIAVSQINMRGFSVPQTNWYSCAPATCGTTDNINTELTADYDPTSVTLADGATAFTAGPIGLAQGQSTIVYLKNAGTLLPLDAGNTYALQIQAGQASAVQQVLVVSAN